MSTKCLRHAPGAKILALGLIGLLQTAILGGSSAQADDSASLAEKMLSALTVDGAKHERAGDFDDAVTALKRAGYIHKRYDAKEDYSERWKVLKPLDLYGARVLVVSNEREGKDIGCCMQNRTEILMAATGETDKLRDFAKTNACRLEHDEPSDQESMKETLRKLKIRSDSAKFVQLVCTGELS